MSRLFRALLFAGAAIGLAAPALAAPASPPAAELKAKVIVALGGEAQLAGLRSLTAKGSMEGVSGFPGPYEMAAKAPASRRVSWDIGYFRQTTAVDPAQGWEQVATVRQLAGEELARDQREARFNLVYRLLKDAGPVEVTPGRCGERDVRMMRFPTGDQVGVDGASFLPACLIRTERYEEGPVAVETDLADYRRVEGLMLPFAIDEQRPDNGLKVRIDRYEVNPQLPDSLFANPNAGRFGEPIALQIATLPEHIYKEEESRYTPGDQRNWGMYFYPSDGWSLDLMVREALGRYLEPAHAHVDFYAGDRKVGSQDWERDALLAMRRYPIARFTPQGEIYGFRQNFNAPINEGVDRLSYTYEARAADGRTYSAHTDIPVTYYTPRTSLIFPMKGKFMVMSGHEYYENEHKYERSQQFGIDIVGLGPNFELATNNGAHVEDYVAYAKREIIAPAAGKVVFARNDIPDGTVKAAYLKLPHAKEAIAGNLVVIDHGNNEFSIFCHMHFGSVRVKTGDVVTQGQVIGLLGAAGSPGFPHLHYQLQSGPEIFGADGLPLKFTNIERVGWIGSRYSEDETGTAPVDQPRDGVFMQAN